MDTAGAGYLARIIGTEEDKVNCSFYFKIGACRHGDGCSRLHLKPNFSQTILLAHMYVPPAPAADGQAVDDTEAFNDFFEEMYDEMRKHGDIEELIVCENLGDHMFGNTYIKFFTEEDAEKAFNALYGRYYGGRLVQVEYSPVTDFREARCRQHHETSCARGGYCNFMHCKPIPAHMRRYFRQSSRRERGHHAPGGGKYSSSYRGDRSRERERHRDERSDRRSRDRGRDRDDRERRPSRRETSQERRDKIANWNLERESKK